MLFLFFRWLTETVSLFPHRLAHPGCSSCPAHQHWHMPRWSGDGWPLRLREPCWAGLMLLLPAMMQDLPLSPRSYPLAQEHTTEFCSSLQNWSQSPLSRLQNFRVAMRQAYWLSRQTGETEAAAGWEEGQQHQGDNTNQSGPQRTIRQKAKGQSQAADAYQLVPVQKGWAAQSRLKGCGDHTFPHALLTALVPSQLVWGNHGIHSGEELSVCQVLGTRLSEGP